MISILAQLLVLSGQVTAPDANKKITVDTPSEHYRPYCPECNDAGYDARLPCEGH